MQFDEDKHPEPDDDPDAGAATTPVEVEAGTQRDQAEGDRGSPGADAAADAG